MRPVCDNIIRHFSPIARSGRHACLALFFLLSCGLAEVLAEENEASIGYPTFLSPYQGRD
jgi:hypothetical protein